VKMSVLVSIAVGSAVAGGSFAVANSASGGGSPASDSRADAYLAATARELHGSGLSVDRIRREVVVDDHEVYALEGPGTRCILVAETSQPAGKSQSLGCQPSEETKPLGSGFERPAGEGVVDLVWTGQDATAVSARAGGQDLATQSGETVLAVIRPDANAGGTVTWTAAGQSHSVDLISAQELDVRRRAAIASAGSAG
jgi:hypothetical protein